MSCSDDHCRCGCCKCLGDSDNDDELQTISIEAQPPDASVGIMILSPDVRQVSSEAFDAIDRLGGTLTRDQALRIGIDLDDFMTDDDEGFDSPESLAGLPADLRMRLAQAGDFPQLRKDDVGPGDDDLPNAPPKDVDGRNTDGDRQDGGDEKSPKPRGPGDEPIGDLGPPCKRTCKWIISPTILPRPARTDAEGEFNKSTNSFYEFDGPGTKHLALASTLGGTCSTPEFSKTVTHAGQIGFRWRLACIKEDDSGECPACTGGGRVEALHMATSKTFTWVGPKCETGARRSQGLAAQWAILDIDDKRVFFEKVGAQSGDDISSTISSTVGAEVSAELSKEPKIGGKLTASITSSETRNKKSGEAKDRMNTGTQGRDVKLKGQAVLRTGAKANLTTAGRAGGTVETFSEATAIYGFLDSSCSKKAIFGWYAGHVPEAVRNAENLMARFWEFNGFPNHPFKKR